MNAITTMVLGNFDDPLAIEIRGRISKIDGKWGAQGMLGFGIWMRIDSRRPHAIFRCSPANSPNPRQNQCYIEVRMQLTMLFHHDWQ